MAVAADHELVGREHEVLRLQQFISALPDGPRAITVRGKPGIGKTSLWRAGIEEGERAARLLSARCVEGELPLALVGLSDLLGDAFDDAADELEDHDRAALAAALGLVEPGLPPSDPLGLPRASLALLRLLARERPVLIAIDDVQWLDPSSARILAFAVRRLSEAPVAILVTQRGDGPDPLDLSNALGGSRHEELWLGPLTLGAITHLVRSRYAVALPRPVLARVHEASGGNPMFALEFARSFDGDRPRLGPIAIPSSLLDLVRARVERYPDEVRRILAIVAAADRPTPSLLARVDHKAPDLLGAAADLDALAVGDDGLIRFSHPLVGSAVYWDLNPAARRSLHAELAPFYADVEDRARHLALAAAGPESAVAELLDQAAAAAYARGAPEAAAELALEALRLTPLEDPQLFERSLGVAWRLADAGRMAEADEMLDGLLAGGIQGAQRTRALLARGGLADDVEDGLRLADEALAHTGKAGALRAEVFLQLSSCHLYRGDLAASEAAAREALAASEETGDGPLVAAALGTVANRAELAGRPEPDLLGRAAALEEEWGGFVRWPSVRELSGRRLLRMGDLGGAREALEPELARFLRQGALPERYRVSRDLADVERHAGNWELAERYIDDAEEDAAVAHERWSEAELVQRRAALEVLRGNVQQARDLAARGIACADAIHWPHLAAMNRWEIGSLELSLDDPAQAWQALEDVRRTPTWGRLEVVEAVTDAIEALVGLGRLDEAETLLHTLYEDRDRGNLFAGPASMRCEGLLRLARGDLEEALAVARAAAAGFETAGFRLQSARSLLAAGEVLRRAGERRRAGEQLDEARAIFLELGAARWVERCDNELRRARPRPRSDGELTHAERQVAALVAAGKKNREVGAQLYTTVATVEAHLTRIYRKLGIRSRTELARLVADGRLTLDEE